MLIASAGHSQTKDTVCIPVADAKRKLIQIERLQADSAKLVLKQSEITDMQNLNNSFQTTIKNLNNTIAAQNSLVTSQQLQITAMQKAYKKQKRKTIFTAICGVAAAGGLIYLLK